MKVSNLFTELPVNVFLVTDNDADNMLDWEVEPVDKDLIPEEEGVYLVRAVQVFPVSACDCFVVVSMPERIAATAIIKNDDETLVSQAIHDLPFRLIPAVAAAGHGNYELYYVKENPQPGIDILRVGLAKADDKSCVAEDVGYIFRDEERIEEAIEAFLVSVEHGPSSEYIYLELSQLFQLVGKAEQSKHFLQLFTDNGGIV